MTNYFSSKSIIDYGKSQGYSPKEINQALKNAKSSLVEYGINAGYKGSDINKALSNAGYSNYNPLTAKANWENLLPNLGRNAREFARDMKTIGGVAIQPFIDVANAPQGTKMDAAKQRFMNALQDDKLRKTILGATTGAAVGTAVGPIGTIGGGITGGLLGLLGPEQLGNAFLAPYETSIQDIKSGKSGIGTDILQGAMRNPLYSGIDILSAGGAKALGGAGRAIGKAVPSNAPMLLQQLIPSPGMRDLSRTATNAFQYSRAKNSELIEPLEKLLSTPGIDNEKIVRNILTNEGELSAKELEIAKDIKTALQKGEQKAIEYSLMGKEPSRVNIVAQYGMQKLRSVMPDILHDDIVTYVKSGKPSGRIEEYLIKNPELKPYLDDVISEGDKLYKNKNIAYLTQVLAPTIDPRGEIIANAITKTGNGYFGTNRIIGRATTQDLAKVLEDSIAYQQKQISKTTEAIDVIEDILQQPGVATMIKGNTEVHKGTTVISPKRLRENLAQEFQLGRDADISKALKDSGIAEEGAYLIPNVYFKALDNMFRPISSGTGKDMLNAFKKTVLANPHWVALNRIGNWTNNSMGGVKVSDYTDAIRYMKMMPKQLKAQTSFNSYVGDNVGGLSSSIIKPMKTLAKEVKKFGESDKSLEDLGRVAGQTLANTSNVLSNPVFRFEASAEAVDRFANFIRQAKREAATTKSDWKEIIKRAENDNNLFNKLNTQVNKDLGDYVGRNYLIPNGAYELLRNTVPFYRFLTQTGRTTFHQLANHPIAFQSTVVAPSKSGKQFSEQILNTYKLDPEDYEGGVPYKQQMDGTMRFIGTEPLPAGAVAQDLLSTKNKLGLLSPQLNMIPNILSYKKGEGWLPTSPGLTQYKMAKGTTKGYEPTTGERVGYAVSQLANTFYAPVRMSRGWMREALNTAIGRPTLSNYDTDILHVNPLSYARTLPVETLGKWVGIQTMPYYPKYVERPKKLSKNQLKKIGIYNRQYNENTKR